MVNSNIELTLILGLFISNTFLLLPLLAFIQQKDYFLGRILAARSWFSWSDVPWQFSSILLISGLQIILNNTVVSGWYLAGFFVLYLLEYVKLWFLLWLIAEILVSITQKKFRRPKFTIRLILIAVIAIWILVGFFLIGYVLLPVNMMIFLLAGWGWLWFSIVVFANQSVKLVAFQQHKRLLARSSKLLRQSGIEIVGITGSYGKSTMKGFLQTILSEQLGAQKVLATPGSINTDIGISQYLLSKQAEISKVAKFILEVDGYTKGTIERVVSYFNPSLIVVTGINTQHLQTLGGSTDDTISANLEIFSQFDHKDKFIAILNADSQLTLRLAKLVSDKFTNAQIYFYGSNSKVFFQKEEIQVNCFPSNISTKSEPGKNVLKFDLNFVGINPLIAASDKMACANEDKATEKSKDKKFTIKDICLPVSGDFNTTNWSGSALAALAVTGRTGKIAQAGTKAKLKSNTLELTYLPTSRLEVIDDSFNANPDSVNANLKLLEDRDNQLPAENLVVFAGLYEVGNKQDTSKLNRIAIAKYLKAGFDVLFSAPQLLLDDDRLKLLDISNLDKNGTLTIGNDPELAIEAVRKLINKSGISRVFIVNKCHVKLKKFILILE